MSPSDFPVDIVSYELQDPVLRERTSYTIRNRSKAGLVALVTHVTLSSDLGEEISIVHVADSWEQDRPFANGGAEHQLPNTTTVRLLRGHLQRLTIKPLYAEFDDGTRVGTDADSVHNCLVANREKFLAAADKALDAYTKDGSEALNLVLQENRELSLLSLIGKSGGVPAVVRELTRKRRLAL